MDEAPETDLQRRIQIRLRSLTWTEGDLVKRLPKARDIIRGKSRSPRYETLRELADVLNVEPSWLTTPLDENDYERSLDSPADISQIRVGEVNLRAAAGGGAMLEREDESAIWSFPATWFRASFNAPTNQIKVITIWGDSMEPDICSGDKAIVDIGWRAPSPPGFFVLYDGIGLVAKQLEHVPQSDPPVVTIKSTNPRYDSYQRTVDEVQIYGRIVGVIRRF